ncbi:MAG: glycosyltransferase family 2 protein, partial [Planctomycetota bacterium]
LHRYLGNPFLTLLGRVLFRAPIRDSQCGLRGFSREAMNTVGLRTTGMEFASEMVVKSTLHGLKIAEVPTTLSPDGRSRPPHLRSWRDGSRILRFHLLHSPRWLFYLPGMFLAGLSAALFLSADGDASAGLSTRMFASVLIMIAAVQSIVTGLLATRFGIQYGVLPGHANGGGRRETVHGAKSLWVLERAAPIGITLLIVGGLVLGLSGGDGPRSAMALLSGGVALLTGFHLILAALVDCLFALGRD